MNKEACSLLITLTMLFQLLIPIVVAIPSILDRLRENAKQSDGSGSDDDISIPSLGGSSIESDLSICDALNEADMCHLLGPVVAKDELQHMSPIDFVRPKNLEHSKKFDLNVGYFRIRRAILNENNDFWEEKVLNRALKYKK